jgi:hypothetical protein
MKMWYGINGTMSGGVVREEVGSYTQLCMFDVSKYFDGKRNNIF